MTDGATGSIAICAIMKNEARNILEWIAYHRAIGVEMFFLYDNGSGDGVDEMLAPLVQAGIVVYIPWPFNPGQIEAYSHHAETQRDRWTYTAFIDLDEFIHPFHELLPDFLARFGDASAIALQWMNFGPSGHDLPPDGLLIEAFDRRMPDDCPVHGHVKTIVRTASYIRPITPHAFVVHGQVVDEYGNPVVVRDGDYSIQPVLSHTDICINHYYTRSRLEWREKVERGMADSATDAPNRRDVAWIDIYERDANTLDRRMERWAGPTRAELRRLDDIITRALESAGNQVREH